MNNQTLSVEEEKEAKILYEEFFRKYPNKKNPSDINSPEKEEFAKEKGSESMNLMQKARKQSYDFTKQSK